MLYVGVDMIVVVSIKRNFGVELVDVFVNRIKVVYVEIFVGEMILKKRW